MHTLNGDIVELLWQYGVQHNTYYSRQCKTGKMYRANGYAVVAAVLYTDCDNKNQRCNIYVARMGKVDICLHDVAHTDSRHHTVED